MTSPSTDRSVLGRLIRDAVDRKMRDTAFVREILQEAGIEGRVQGVRQGEFADPRVISGDYLAHVDAPNLMPGDKSDFDIYDTDIDLDALFKTGVTVKSMSVGRYFGHGWETAARQQGFSALYPLGYVQAGLLPNSWYIFSFYVFTPSTVPFQIALSTEFFGTTYRYGYSLSLNSAEVNAPFVTNINNEPKRFFLKFKTPDISTTYFLPKIGYASAGFIASSNPLTEPANLIVLDRYMLEAVDENATEPSQYTPPIQGAGTVQNNQLTTGSNANIWRYDLSEVGHFGFGALYYDEGQNSNGYQNGYLRLVQPIIGQQSTVTLYNENNPPYTQWTSLGEYELNPLAGTQYIASASALNFYSPSISLDVEMRMMRKTYRYNNPAHIITVGTSVPKTLKGSVNPSRIWFKFTAPQYAGFGDEIRTVFYLEYKLSNITDNGAVPRAAIFNQMVENVGANDTEPSPYKPPAATINTFSPRLIKSTLPSHISRTANQNFPQSEWTRVLFNTSFGGGGLGVANGFLTEFDSAGVYQIILNTEMQSMTATQSAIAGLEIDGVGYIQGGISSGNNAIRSGGGSHVWTLWLDSHSNVQIYMFSYGGSFQFVHGPSSNSLTSVRTYATMRRLA